jgi:Zn-dependent protease with chaperone function
MDIDEVMAVLAHEIGHSIYFHNPIMYLINTLKSLALISVIIGAYKLPGYLEAFGFDRAQD